jgi:hypothetical protein
MKPKPNPLLIPVLRRPRGDWEIPPFETPASRQERLANEARIRAFTEGTTPYGREIFRRTLEHASTLVEAGKGLLEAAKELEDEIRLFPELHREFALLLARTCGADPAEEPQGSPWAWATLMILRARLIERLNQQQLAAGPADGSAQGDPHPNGS